MHLFTRKCPASNCCISSPRTGLFGKETATVSSGGEDHRTGYCAPQSDKTRGDVVRQLKLYLQDNGNNPGGGGAAMAVCTLVHWNPAVRDMRTHISKWIMETIKEAYIRADRQYG